MAKDTNKETGLAVIDSFNLPAMIGGDYTPEEMVGMKVVVVANLKSRMLRGLESKGMLLFGENGDRWDIVTTEAPDGAEVR